MATLTWFILLTSIFGAFALQRINERCTDQYSCVPNSHSKNGTCQCVPGYFEKAGRCAAGVSAKCYTNNNCEAENSFCNTTETRCQCKPYFAVSPIYTCEPFAEHQKPCKYDSQCSSALPHSSCNVTAEGQRCECTDKYFFRKDECYPKKYVPEECEYLPDCFTPNSWCQGGKCVCIPKHKFENGTCNSSIITRPLFLLVALILLGMKVLS